MDKPMEKSMEMAQLLARFKLQVKRSLSESVDLEQLTRDPGYARQRLNEIEELADDEELLVMVLRLRDHLLPLNAHATGNPPARETRTYLNGARAW